MTIKKILRDTIIFVVSAAVTCVFSLAIIYIVRHSAGGIKASSHLSMLTSIIFSVVSMLIAFFIQTLLH